MPTDPTAPPTSTATTAPSPAPRGELAWIERIRQRSAGTMRGASSLRLGIGDDCAILAPPRGHEIVVTTDMSLEGRHFRRDWHPARAVGHRALARGLSDLAAMGARPLAAFLSIAIPRSVADEPAWMEDFLSGLLELAAATKTPLAGGDTAEAPGGAAGGTGALLSLDIILLGAAPTGRALRRSGAKPGDRIFVTGSPGGAAAELSGLAAGSVAARDMAPQKVAGPNRTSRNSGAAKASSADHPHLYPQPRLTVGQALLRRRLASACIDLSDGLSTDLAHLCVASNVAAEIHTDQLPLHPLTLGLSQEAALHNALHGGEDYELLFTAPAAVSMPRAIAGIPVTCIGEIRRAGRARPRVSLIGPDGTSTALEPGGWEHLK